MDLEERTKNGVIRGQPSPLGWLQYKPALVAVAVYFSCYNLQWPGTCSSSHAHSVGKLQFESTGTLSSQCCLLLSLSYWFKPCFHWHHCLVFKEFSLTFTVLWFSWNKWNFVTGFAAYTLKYLSSRYFHHIEKQAFGRPCMWVFCSSFCRMGWCQPLRCGSADFLPACF